jgi:hypothetical protein
LAHAAESAAAKEHPAGNRRRLVEVQCGFAEMARKEAEAVSMRATEARRLYDEQAAVLAPLLTAVDPVAVKAAKDKAHVAFRSSIKAARSRAQVETAAVVWLAKVNQINSENRAAQVRLKNDREAAAELLSQADKLADTAESARSMADAAAEACRSARTELAESGETEIDEPVAAADRFVEAAIQEAASESAAAGPVELTTPAPPATVPPSVPDPPPTALPAAASTFAQAPTPETEVDDQSSDWLAIDVRAPHPQAIIRLLRRDDRTMNSLAERLAANESSTRSSWQLLLSNFVDAVVGAAIDEGWFEFPPGNPFWDLFTSEEAREVARGLAALGFRYDGFGVFADERVPGQRDLALAVGAAGLLPVRIRYWPKSQEAAELYKDVRVASEAFIAAKAPALTLGELVRVLGRRSEMLADLWNDWPRVRTLLLSPA